MQSLQHFTKLPPPRMVRRLLRKLKRDDDLEAIVEFTYILMKIYFTERPDFIQKAVRLAFHACIGGCDGCINYDHPGNKGLMAFVEEYVKVYEDNGVKNVMSFMDFIVYSTYAAVDHAIEINNRDCREEGCVMPPMMHTFKYGRTDCDHPDAPNTNDEGKFNIPSSRMNADENMAYFADEFDMHEEWEVVALMGAHTLGGGMPQHSGHIGVFVEGESTWFNNKYFKIMLDQEVDWSQVISTGTPENEVLKWRWDGFGAVKSGAYRCNHTLISDDCQSEYDSAKANGDLETFYHRCATEGGETPLHTRCALCCEGDDDRNGEKIGMMLNTDIELFYDVIHIDENGRTGCTLPGSTMDLPVCERYSSYNIGEIYAENKDLFITDFGIVLDKMLLNKVDLEKVKDLKMKSY